MVDTVGDTCLNVVMATQQDSNELPEGYDVGEAMRQAEAEYAAEQEADYWATRMTLRADGDGGHLPFIDTDSHLPERESRRLVEFNGPKPWLTDEYQKATLADGREVLVRRADCGAACCCAGEYRMVPHE